MALSKVTKDDYEKGYDAAIKAQNDLQTLSGLITKTTTSDGLAREMYKLGFGIFGKGGQLSQFANMLAGRNVVNAEVDNAEAFKETLRKVFNKTDLDELTYPTGTTAITNAITYSFTEANDAELPSFSLEQVFSKLPSTNQYRTNTAADHEDTNFVKIARGCRVNTLTMTANENEEIKMTLSCNTRNVHTLEQNEAYEAKRGVSDETQYVNYKDTQAEFREPFFFSDGTLKAFGTSFVRLTSLTLTMNNTLTDKRYLGVGNKTVQEAIPAQRTYEIQFNGYVTDDQLYTELLNQDENNETSAANTANLIFTKSNNEKITLRFKDYFLSANEFPMADDKGPIEVTATIMPRSLEQCEVITHWLLQG